MDPEKKKKTKKSVIAAVTAASVAVAGLTDSPDAIIRGNEEETVSSEKFKEVSTEINEIDQDIDEEDDEEEKKKKGRIKNRIAERMLSLPLIVRLFIIMPLWLLGTWILFISGSLLSLLSPFTGRIVTTAIAALVVGILFYLGAKTAFPDLPLKKIINRKTLPWILFGVLFINAADYFLEMFWADYQNIQKLIKAGCYLVLLFVIFGFFAAREMKRRKKLRITETETEEEIENNNEEKPLIVTVGDETYSIITPKKEGKTVH